MSPKSLGHRPNRMTEFTVEELQLIRRRVPTLNGEANAELARRAQITDPGWIYFRFAVQFDRTGIKYQFAALRVPGGVIYTTAVGAGNMFESWQDLIHWLQQPDKYWVSNITELVHMDGHRGVSPLG